MSERVRFGRKWRNREKEREGEKERVIKREREKERVGCVCITLTPDSEWSVCFHCDPRICNTEIGLVSHTQTHTHTHSESLK